MYYVRETIFLHAMRKMFPQKWETRDSHTHKPPTPPKKKTFLPNHQQWYARWKLSRNMYTLRTRFCTLGADLHAQRVLIDKKFLRRSSVGRLLRVRCWLGEFSKNKQK